MRDLSDPNGHVENIDLFTDSMLQPVNDTELPSDELSDLEESFPIELPQASLRPGA